MARFKYTGPVRRDPVSKGVREWAVWQRLARCFRRFIKARPPGDSDLLR